MRYPDEEPLLPPKMERQIEHPEDGAKQNPSSKNVNMAKGGSQTVMALGDPLQWIVIGVIVIVIFLWGPQKIPDIARSLGMAKREFDQASKEMSGAASGTPARVTPDISPDQALIGAARGLGIATEGKTRAQISQEIVEKAKPQP